MTVLSSMPVIRTSRRSTISRLYRAALACVEPLETRVLMSSTLNYTVTDSNTHLLNLSLVQVNAVPTVQLTDNNAVVAQQSLANTSGVVVVGGAGNDTFQVDFAGGSPIPAGGLIFTGGGTNSNLVLQNGSFTNEAYATSGAASGSIALDAAQITFSNVALITDLAPATNTTFATATTDGPVNVVNGAVTGSTQTLEVNDAGVGSFAVTDMANKTHVTVDTNGGNDTVLLDLPAAPAGLSTLFLNSYTGSDSFAVQETPFGVSTTINGLSPTNSASGPDSVTVGSGLTVQQILGPVNISDDAYYVDIVINDVIDPVGQTVNFGCSSVQGLAPAVISYNQSAINTLTMNLGGGANTVTVSCTVAGSVNTINTGNGNDTILVQSIAGGSTLNINSQSGNISVGVDFSVLTQGTESGFSSIQGAINLSNSSGSTALNIDTSTESSAQTITADGASVTVATTVPQGPASSTIQYGSGVSSVFIKTGSGADTFNLTPSSAVAFNVDAGGPTTSPGDTLNVNLAGTANAAFGAATVGGYQYAYTFAAQQPVNFVHVEGWTPLANSNLADVALSFNAPANVNENGTITYSFTVTNFGPNDATNVVLSDQIPAGVSFQSATGGTSAFVNGLLTLNLGTLVNGASVSGTIVLLSADEIPSVTNIASVSSNVADPQPSNNSQSVTTAVKDAPLVVTAGFTAAAVEGNASAPLVLATFTDAGGAESMLDYSAVIAWGDGTTSAGTVAYNPSTMTFTVTGAHTYAEDGSYTAAVTVHHDWLTDTTVTSTVNVSDPAVVASGGSNLTAVEGAGSTFTLATFTDPGGAEPLADYSASVDWGDGSNSAGVISYNSATGVFTVSGSHTYADDGAYTATLMIHHDSAPIMPMTDGVTVSDPGVSATGGLALNATEGGAFGSQVVATFTDPGGAEPLSDYSATVNWGDGTFSTGVISLNPATGVFSVSGGHTYASAGSYTVSVGVNHDAAPAALATSSVAVADPALLVTGGFSFAAIEGSVAGSQVLGTFTDPAGAEPLSHYTATIDWGDGSTSVGMISLNASTGVFTVLGGHLYAQAGSFPVGVSVQHDLAPASSASSNAVVSDPPVVAQGGFNFTATAGASSGTQTLATFTDPAGAQALSHYSATVVWGDGVTSAGTLSFNPANGTFTVQGAHTYSASGNFAVGVTIHHDSAADVAVSDSAAVAANDPLGISNVAITSPINEGGTVHLTGVVSGAAAGPMTLVVNWGPNQGTSTYQLAAGTSKFDLTHVYADNPAAPATSFPVNITLSNATGKVTATTSAVVKDVAPVANPITGPTAGVRGQTLSFADAFTDAGVLDTHTASINWGDGSQSAGLVTESHGSGTVMASHVFTASGTYRVALTITDKDGMSTTVVQNVAVVPVLVELDPVYGGRMLAIGGTTAADTIQIRAQKGGNTLNVVMNGVTTPVPGNVGRIVVFGQSGNDFVQLDRNVSTPAFVYGGSGNNIFVGGGGPDVLVGGSGNDLLIGGSSRNILIGGGGSDILIGGGADDILLASRTTYANNDVALAAIFNEWNVGTESYASRVNHTMHGGGLNGSYVFNSSTVFNDNANDILFGNGGSDWYLFNTGDTIIGKNPGDIATRI